MHKHKMCFKSLIATVQAHSYLLELKSYNGYWTAFCTQMLCTFFQETLNLMSYMAHAFEEALRCNDLLLPLHASSLHFFFVHRFETFAWIVRTLSVICWHSRTSLLAELFLHVYLMHTVGHFKSILIPLQKYYCTS